jgi:uncharacterized protein YlxW (UPF0749 family)
MARVRYKNRVLVDTARKPPPERRLSGAMHAVDQALSDQRAELAEFRRKMDELRGVMKDMQAHIDDYAESVDAIDLDGLRETARKLRDDADDT